MGVKEVNIVVVEGEEGNEGGNVRKIHGMSPTRGMGWRGRGSECRWREERCYYSVAIERLYDECVLI